MNTTSVDKFCTIERTPGRIRLRIRHEPAQLPGALMPPREGARVLRGFAAQVAFHLNEARSGQR
jgi:hypothetical protein